MATDSISKGRHPSTLDNVVVALLRNRLGYRQLQEQLLRLQHEEVSALRMLRTMEHQLCSRFVHTTRAPQPSSAVLARLASTLPPRASLIHAAATTAAAEDLAPADAKAARVRMFDTHWPGFCYRRDGTRRAPCCPGGRDAARRRAKMAARDARETREASARERRVASEPGGIPMPPISAATFTPEELRSLVMTNGEADIRKVLCLHALGAIAVPCPCGSKGGDSSNRRGSSFRGRTPQCTLETAFIPKTMPRAGLPCYVLQVEDNRTGAARSAAMWMAASADEPWTAARALLESSSTSSSRDTFPRPVPGGPLPMTVIPLPALRPTPVALSTATGISGPKVDDKLKAKTSEIEKSREGTVPKSTSKVSGVEGTDMTDMSTAALQREEEAKYPLVKLYVNEEVDALLGSVLQALEVTNPSKLELARSIAASPSRLTSLLAEPLLLPFLDSLMGTDVLNSRRCFTVKTARLLPSSMLRPAGDNSSDTAYELRLPACTASADAIRHLISQIRRTLSREPDDEIDLGLGGSKAHAAATRIAMLPLRTLTPPCPLPADVTTEDHAPRQLSPPPPPRHAPPRGPMPTPAFAGSLKGPSPASVVPPAATAVPQPTHTDILLRLGETSSVSVTAPPAPFPIHTPRGVTQTTESPAEGDEDPRTWQRLLDWRLGRDPGSMTSRVSLAGSLTGTMTGTSYGVKKSLSSLDSSRTLPVPPLRPAEAFAASGRLGLRTPHTSSPTPQLVSHVHSVANPLLRPLFSALREDEESMDSSVTLSTIPGDVHAVTSGQRLAQIRVARARRDERHLVDTVRRHLRMLTTDPDQQRASKHGKRPRQKRSQQEGDKKNHREQKLRQQLLGIKPSPRKTVQAPSGGAMRPRLPLGGNVDEEMVMKEMLGRLSDPQRIMVGLRTAAIKAHKVNMEGVEPKVKSPLAELVAPVLSRASILTLTAPGEDAVRRSLLQAHAAAAAGVGVLGLMSPSKHRSHTVDAFRQRSPRFGRQSRLAVFASPNATAASPTTVTALSQAKTSTTKVSGRKSPSPKGGGRVQGFKVAGSRSGAKVGVKSSTGTAVGGKSGKSVSMRKSTRRIRIRGPDPTSPVAGAGGAAAAASTAAGGAATTGGGGGKGGGADEASLEVLGERMQRPLSATTLTRLRIDVATRETQRKVHNFLKEMNALTAKESAPLERRRVAEDKRIPL